MQVLEYLKEKANRSFLLSQKAKKEGRKRRLLNLYRHYYQVYRRQRVLIEEIDRSSLSNLKTQGA